MQLSPYEFALPRIATGGRRSTRGKRGGSRANDRDPWAMGRKATRGVSRRRRSKRGGTGLFPLSRAMGEKATRIVPFQSKWAF